MRGDGGPCPFGRGAGHVAGSGGLRPQLRRIGIESEDDLGLALRYVAGQPVPERDSGRPDPVVRELDQLPFTAFLRPEPAENFGALDAAIWIFSPVCGLTP